VEPRPVGSGARARDEDDIRIEEVLLRPLLGDAAIVVSAMLDVQRGRVVLRGVAEVDGEDVSR
jgi:hypothetical protein